MQSREDIARLSLKSVGLEGEPTKRQIAAALKANNQFTARLERIAGIVKEDDPNLLYNGRRAGQAQWPEQDGEGIET